MSRISIVSTCESTRSGVANAKDFSVGAVRLANSIRKNGGLFSQAPIYMWYSSDQPPQEAARVKLEELGCILVEGEHKSDPLYSKVKAITDCAKLTPSDYLLWLDSDMLVLNNLDFLVNYMGVDVAATATEKIHHRYACQEDAPVWEKLCRYNGISYEDYEKLNITTMMDEKVGLFNFNSGIVLMRNGTSFFHEYKEIAEEILKGAKSGFVSDYCFDATAITLAVVQERLSWARLPMSFNHYFALHQKILPETTIVHYQDNNLEELYPSLWNII